MYKSIYIINPDCEIFNVKKKVAYKASVKYFGQSFKALIDSNGAKGKHFGLDDYNEDMVITLTIELNNQIFDYLQTNTIE